MVESAADGMTNMARDRELWAATERGVSQLRVYEWDGPCISRGANQAPIECVLPQVLRPTGGRAVLHGDDITITWALPLIDIELAPVQIRRIYSVMMAPIVNSLRECGLPIEFGSEHESDRQKIDCFQSVSRFDLCVGKDKVGGAALATNRYGALLQVSVLYRNSDEYGPFSARSVPLWRVKELGQALTCYIRS